MKLLPSIGAGVTALAAAALVSAAPASATTCTYDPVGHTVSLDLTAPAPNGSTSLSRFGNLIVWHDGPPAAPVQLCGAAHVLNTDAIKLTGTPVGDRVIVSLAGGHFSPGLTPEPFQIPEIEITGSLGGQARDTLDVLGSSAGDQLFAGRDAALGAFAMIGVNGDNDADIVVATPGLLGLQGLGGNDVLVGQGGHGAPAPYAKAMRLLGQAGGDQLIGGNGPDTLVGGPGADTFRAMAGADRLFAQDGVAEVVDGGLGIDWRQADFFDALVSVELA